MAAWWAASFAGLFIPGVAVLLIRIVGNGLRDGFR